MQVYGTGAGKAVHGRDETSNQDNTRRDVTGRCSISGADTEKYDYCCEA